MTGLFLYFIPARIPEPALQIRTSGQYGQSVLRNYDALTEHELVARIIHSPVLRLPRAVALRVMHDINELALESLEKHTVTGIVGEERLRFLNPRTCDSA